MTGNYWSLLPPVDRGLAAIVAAGVIVMGATAWFSSSRSPARDLGSKNARFMHCRKCGKELPYNAKRAEKGCLRCGSEEALVGTAESVALSGQSSLFARLLAPLLIEATVLLAV